MSKEITSKDRVFDFSTHSHARVGLGHVGGQLNTTSWLRFQADFAQAKDAVFSSYATDKIAGICNELQLPNFIVNSATTDTLQYITRPDLGRLPSAAEFQQLQTVVSQHQNYMHRDLLIVISGGLSPIAVQDQIPVFFPSFIENVKAHNLTLTPVIINPRGRVALGDQLNTLFKAKITIMLIGERPGLTIPNSLGIYFTYDAKPGRTDEMRNCISNIHEKGLPVEAAINKLQQLISAALQQKVSGIGLELPESSNLR